MPELTTDTGRVAFHQARRGEYKRASAQTDQSQLFPTGFLEKRDGSVIDRIFTVQ